MTSDSRLVDRRRRGASAGVALVGACAMVAACGKPAGGTDRLAAAAARPGLGDGFRPVGRRRHGSAVPRRPLQPRQWRGAGCGSAVLLLGRVDQQLARALHEGRRTDPHRRTRRADEPARARRLDRSDRRPRERPRLDISRRARPLRAQARGRRTGELLPGAGEPGEHRPRRARPGRTYISERDAPTRSPAT